MSDISKKDDPIRGLLAKRAEIARRLQQVSGNTSRPLQRFTGTVYLAIDSSGSMGRYGRIDMAKDGAIGYANEALRKNYQIGLISFGSDARVNSEPTQDMQSFKSKVQQIEIAGSTNMADAIGLAISPLSESRGERVICLATDGQPDDPEATLLQAKEAKQRGIDIMTIGVEGADFEFLRMISTREDLAVEIATHLLKEGITSMAKLLNG